MSQHDMTIANGAGLAVRGDIEAALQALASNSKGPSAPSTPYAGQSWIDDDTPSATLWTHKRYDGTDWIVCGYIDVTNNLYMPAATFSGIAVNEAKGADIASATTTDIGAATGNYVDVTGTTTITGLGTVQAGVERTVRFTGALTLTHHATSLILPGGKSITTVAGDVAIFRSLGSGNWRCVAYTRLDGRPVNQVKGADIASATTTDIGAADGDYVDVTGTTTITGLGTIAAGVERTVRFTGALTLTHNATSLILPGGKSITTVAGDVATFRSLGSGNWRCVAYTRLDGRPVNQVKGADIASATTTDIGAADGDFVDVTGTTTITGLGTIAAGVERTVRFTGALQLTHNATSLILPGAVNYKTVAGTVLTFRSLGGGNWVCTSAMRPNNGPVVTVYTSGSGTHTMQVGCRWTRIRMVGGGGGGAGSGTSPGNGGNGGSTTFDTLTASGGALASGTTAGAGGTGTNGDVNIAGSRGQTGASGYTFQDGGLGGGTVMGVSVPATASNVGQDVPANTGVGGSGGSADATASPGGGGGGGGYVEKTIAGPAASYSYAVGAAGSAGSAGTGTNPRAGRAGSAGIIIIEEHFG